MLGRLRAAATDVREPRSSGSSGVAFVLWWVGVGWKGLDRWQSASSPRFCRSVVLRCEESLVVHDADVVVLVAAFVCGCCCVRVK